MKREQDASQVLMTRAAFNRGARKGQSSSTRLETSEQRAGRGRGRQEASKKKS